MHQIVQTRIVSDCCNAVAVICDEHDRHRPLVGWASTINGDDVFAARGNKPFAAFVVMIGDVTVVALVVGVVFRLLLLMMLHVFISLITRTTHGR